MNTVQMIAAKGGALSRITSLEIFTGAALHVYLTISLFKSLHT